ncbi:MAG: dihydroorotate dehydrogenase [Aerococcus sp.]|nr:dihydroorotate dehydrogenase [Aerococcus sp.]
MSRLAVSLPGLQLKNPLMPASGTFGFGDTHIANSYDLNQLGAIVIKTTTPNPHAGNPDPKIALLNHNGVMNAVGLQNPGVDAVTHEKIPAIKEHYPDLPLIASIGGFALEDYERVAKTLNESDLIAAFELNISCPNVHHGGMQFGTTPEMTEQVVKTVRQCLPNRPLYVKLTPNVTDITAIAKAALAGGADGLVLINTVLGLHFDLKTKRPVLGNGMGGYSGPGIKPLAIRMIHQVHQACPNVPLIGVGGVETVDDVLEMLLAGANAVQVGSAHFQNPHILPDLISQLPKRMDELGIATLSDYIVNRPTW